MRLIDSICHMFSVKYLGFSLSLQQSTYAPLRALLSLSLFYTLSLLLLFFLPASQSCTIWQKYLKLVTSTRSLLSSKVLLCNAGERPLFSYRPSAGIPVDNTHGVGVCFVSTVSIVFVQFTYFKLLCFHIPSIFLQSVSSSAVCFE